MAPAGGHSGDVSPRRVAMPMLAISSLYAGLAALSAHDAVTDWAYVDKGARTLLSGDGLRVYDIHPDVQVGPVALLVAAPLRMLGPHAPLALAILIGALAGPLLVLSVDRPQRTKLVLASAVLVLPWTEVAVRCHVDDALAVLGLALAARFAWSQRPLAAAVLVALATGAKPWACIGVSLVLVLVRERRTFLSWVIGLTIAIWLPFVVAGGAGAVQVVHAVDRGSALALVSGLEGHNLPGWYRPAQLAVAVGVALLAARRPLDSGLTAGVTARTVLEPSAVTYYASAVCALGVVEDLRASGRVPVRGLLGLAIWAVPYVGVGTLAVSCRLLLLALLLGHELLPARGGRDPVKASA